MKKINPCFLVILSLSFFALGFTSCKKYLALDHPPTQLASSTVFDNDATALAAQLAIYSQMEAEGLPYNLIVFTGLSSDELANHSGNVNYVDLFTNNLTAHNTNVLNLWNALYKYIYEANAVIEGVERSSALTATVKQQLTGEARFTRAFCYFYLVNLFGNVPILLTTDYKVNANESRKEKQTVYAQVIRDLTEAKDRLPKEFLGVNGRLTNERVRPTRWAALALLARVQLYTGNWSGAENSTTEVIQQATHFRVQSNLKDVFLKNSQEAIWQLMSVVPRYNSYTGGLFRLSGAPTISSLSASLLRSFEAGDKRAESWISPITVGMNQYAYPNKYKVGQNAATITEYTTVLRLAELFLIRAEAKAAQNDFDGALSDLNAIRARAGLPDFTTTSQTQLFECIQRERRAELFAEFGDRWLNLKRTGEIDRALAVEKGFNWTPAVDDLYPIPQTEILRNANLTQNPGY